MGLRLQDNAMNGLLQKETVFALGYAGPLCESAGGCVPVGISL